MSVNKVNQSTGELSPIAGATYYADMAVGTIVPYGGLAAPNGFLLCQGQSLLRTEYAELFAVIGTSFGSVDSTHFNVPDLRGKTLVGYNSNESEFNTLGKTGGEKSHTLTTNEMPSHNHLNTSTSIYASADVSGTNRLAAASGTGQNYDIRNTFISAGGGQAHNNLQPYNTVNYIIKATSIALPTDFASAVDDKIATNIAANIVDSITDGNMKAVTSNAVYDALENKWQKKTYIQAGAGTLQITLPYGELFLVAIAVPTGASTTVGGLYLVSCTTYNVSAPAIVAIVNNSRVTIESATGRILNVTTTNQYGMNVYVCNFRFNN